MTLLKKNWGIALFIVFVTAYIGISISSNNCAMCVVGDMFSATPTTAEETNDSDEEFAKPWEAGLLNGETYSSVQTQNKVSVLVYWATWCAPCRKEFPVLIGLRNEFDNENLEIIGISVDDAGKDLDSFVNEHGLNYTIVRDSNSLKKAFGPIKYIPTIIIIDKAGKIRYRHTGNVSKEMLKGQISSLIKNS